MIKHNFFRNLYSILVDYITICCFFDFSHIKLPRNVQTGVTTLDLAMDLLLCIMMFLMAFPDAG